MACSSVSEDSINIDNLDLEDKLKWLKEILENGRENFATIEFNGRLSNLINQLTVSVLLNFCVYSYLLEKSQDKDQGKRNHC